MVCVNMYRQNSKSGDTSLVYRIETLLAKKSTSSRHIYLRNLMSSCPSLTSKKQMTMYFNNTYVPKILIHWTFIATQAYFGIRKRHG